MDIANAASASTGAYYGFGAILMILGGLLEFFLGNTFPSVVFCSFGAFWFTFGSTLVPSFNACMLLIRSHTLHTN
jgi:succinate-acetate transporter protein